jgi:hypothetical protein
MHSKKIIGPDEENIGFVIPEKIANRKSGFQKQISNHSYY